MLCNAIELARVTILIHSDVRSFPGSGNNANAQWVTVHG